VEGDKGTGKMCWQCGASFKEANHCHDYSMYVDWRKTMVTMCEYWRSVAVENTYVSKIWSIPGMHISYFKADWMHVGCLGVVSYMLGCIFWELFYDDFGGRLNSPPQKGREACNRIMNMINLASSAMGIEPPLRNVTPTMIRASATSKPKMKTKAAEGRRLVPIVLYILENYVVVTTKTSNS
jgi:hypothetical protein